MLPLRASRVALLMGFLCIAQGARIVRDTADIPTELFKPVGKNAGREPTRSNGGNSTGDQLTPGYPASDEADIRFQERFDGGVEVVTEENDTEEESDFDTQPIYRQGSRRTSGFPLSAGEPNYGSSLQPGYPRFGQAENSRPPFSRSSGFRRSNIRPIFNPDEGINNTSSWASRPIQVPLSSNNFGGQLPSRGSSRPFGSSNNFYRSESYSYSSDGRGPPQISQNVYDSRDPFGGVSLRNFELN